MSQAKRAGQKLRQIIGDEDVYFQVSPYRRTRQTLQHILESFVDSNGDPLPYDKLKFEGVEAGTSFETSSCGSGEEDAGSGCEAESFSPFENIDEDTSPPIEKMRKKSGSINYLRVRSGSLEHLMSADTSGQDICVWPQGMRYKVREDARLREQEFGNYQNAEKMKQSYKDRSTFGPFWYRFDHGESGGDVFDRISDWWASMYREMVRHRYRNYVIVTHGLTMRCLCMYYFKWSVEEFQRVLNPNNCEIWELQRGPDFKYRLVTEARMRNGVNMPSHMTRCDHKSAEIMHAAVSAESPLHSNQGSPMISPCNRATRPVGLPPLAVTGTSAERCSYP